MVMILSVDDRTFRELAAVSRAKEELNTSLRRQRRQSDILGGEIPGVAKNVSIGVDKETRRELHKEAVNKAQRKVLTTTNDLRKAQVIAQKQVKIDKRSEVTRLSNKEQAEGETREIARAKTSTRKNFSTNLASNVKPLKNTNNNNNNKKPKSSSNFGL